MDPAILQPVAEDRAIAAPTPPAPAAASGFPSCCDDPLIVPPSALPAHAVPVGIILADDSVVDFAPSTSAAN